METENARSYDIFKLYGKGRLSVDRCINFYDCVSYGHISKSKP